MNCGLCGAEDHDETTCEYGMGQAAAFYVPEEQPDVEYIASSSEPPPVEVIEPGMDTEEMMDVAQDVAPAMPASYQSKLGVASDLMTLAQSASSGDADTILNAMEQFSKAQYVRFLDITIIGPLLLFWAWRGKLSSIERTMMALIGAGTVIYNGRNYLANKTVVQPEEFQAIKDELQSVKMAGIR